MKKLTVILIMAGLIFLAGCGGGNDADAELAPEGQSATAPVNPQVEESQAEIMESEPGTEETTPEAQKEGLEAGEAAQEEKVYSFSEWDKNLGPGPFTVNQLIEIYGEPMGFFGNIISVSSGDFSIIIDFEGISFELLTAKEEDRFSFDTDENFMRYTESPKFELASSDMDILTEPFCTAISSSSFPLARGIKMGDSKQQVIAAYGGYISDEWQYDDDFPTIRYSYRPDIIEQYTDNEEFNIASQTGSVNYIFENETLIGVEIRWYSGYLAFD